MKHETLSPFGGVITEFQRAKELAGRPVRIITISGRAGTGKTTTGEMLAKRIEDFTGKEVLYIKVGRDLRKKSGQAVIGNVPFDDQTIDKAQKELIKNTLSKQESPTVILEGWMSGVDAGEVIEETKETSTIEQQDPQKPIILRWLFVAKSKVRYARVFKRERKTDPNLTYNAVKNLTIQREEGNKARWDLVHKQIKGVDAFSPINKDNQGKSIYDYIINTTIVPAEEAVEAMLNILVRRQFIKKAGTETNSPTLPSQGTIYEKKPEG